MLSPTDCIEKSHTVVSEPETIYNKLDFKLVNNIDEEFTHIFGQENVLKKLLKIPLMWILNF